jgi:hypothetical protein
MRVEVYDQYSNIYSDNQNNNALTEVFLLYKETLDTSRYTLIHPSSGGTVTHGKDLAQEQAYDLVTQLYVDSLLQGVKVDEKIINLNQGYAEIVIYFDNGRVLNRVIYAS